MHTLMTVPTRFSLGCALFRAHLNGELNRETHRNMPRPRQLERSVDQERHVRPAALRATTTLCATPSLTATGSLPLSNPLLPSKISMLIRPWDAWAFQRNDPLQPGSFGIDGGVFALKRATTVLK